MKILKFFIKYIYERLEIITWKNKNIAQHEAAFKSVGRIINKTVTETTGKVNTPNHKCTINMSVNEMVKHKNNKMVRAQKYFMTMK